MCLLAPPRTPRSVEAQTGIAAWHMLVQVIILKSTSLTHIWFIKCLNVFRHIQNIQKGYLLNMFFSSYVLHLFNIIQHGSVICLFFMVQPLWISIQ